jgi:hypothetical protein
MYIVANKTATQFLVERGEDEPVYGFFWSCNSADATRYTKQGADNYVDFFSIVMENEDVMSIGNM